MKSQMEITKSDYMEAAKLIASCRADRLPYVICVLEQAGFRFPDGAVLELRERGNTRRERAAETRKLVGHESWIPSDDETITLLRKAYLSGVSICSISRISNTNRTVLYEYLNGSRSVPKHRVEAITDAIEELMA